MVGVLVNLDERALFNELILRLRRYWWIIKAKHKNVLKHNEQLI